MSSSNCGCGSDCKCGDNCNCNSMQIEFGEKTTAQTIISGVAPLKTYEEMSFGSEGNGCKCGANCSCGDSCDC